MNGPCWSRVSSIKLKLCCVCIVNYIVSCFTVSPLRLWIWELLSILAFFPIPLAGDGLAFLRHWFWTCLLEEKGEGWNTRQGKPVRDICCITEGETGRPESGVSLLHFIHNQCFAEKTLSHQGKKCLSNEQIPVCSKCQWEINHTCLTAYMLGRKWERWIVHLSLRMSSTLLREESLR